MQSAHLRISAGVPCTKCIDQSPYAANAVCRELHSPIYEGSIQIDHACATQHRHQFACAAAPPAHLCCILGGISSMSARGAAGVSTPFAASLPPPAGAAAAAAAAPPACCCSLCCCCCGGCRCCGGWGGGGCLVALRKWLLAARPKASVLACRLWKPGWPAAWESTAMLLRLALLLTVGMFTCDELATRLRGCQMSRQQFVMGTSYPMNTLHAVHHTGTAMCLYRHSCSENCSNVAYKQAQATWKAVYVQDINTHT